MAQPAAEPVCERSASAMIAACPSVESGHRARSRLGEVTAGPKVRFGRQGRRSVSLVPSGYTVGRTVTAITPCSPFPLPGGRLSRLLVLVRYRLWLEHGGDNCRVHQQVCGLRQGAHDLQPPRQRERLQFYWQG